MTKRMISRIRLWRIYRNSRKRRMDYRRAAARVFLIHAKSGSDGYFCQFCESLVGPRHRKYYTRRAGIQHIIRAHVVELQAFYKSIPDLSVVVKGDRVNAKYNQKEPIRA